MMWLSAAITVLLLFGTQCMRVVQSAERAPTDIAGELLGKMKTVFGKHKMKTAFANGIFANGIMDIVHDISNQRISQQLGSNYGDINVRVLLFWARIFAFSTEQFNTIQKNLMDLKEIQKCVEEAVNTRKEANKAQLLSMFDFAVNSPDAGMGNLMDSFMSALDDDHSGDAQAAADAADEQFGTDSIWIDADQHLGDQYQFMVESFRAMFGCYVGATQDELAQSFFISGAADCVGHGLLHYIRDFLLHSMRWEVQLLHDGNIFHSSAEAGARRRQLLAGGITDTCSNEIPNCNARIIIASVDEPTQKTVFEINVATLATSVVQDDLHLHKHGPAHTLSDAAQAYANATNLRSFIVNFDTAVVALAIPDTAGKETTHTLFDIEVSADQSKHDFTAHLEFRECPIGTGALLLRERIYSHYRVDPQVLATVTVPTASQTWQEFTAGDPSFIELGDNSRTDQYYMGNFPVEVNAQSYLNQFVVNYDTITDVESQMWLTTNNWLTPGFESGPISWKIGLFTLASPSLDAQIGLEYTESTGAASETTTTKRLTIDLAGFIRNVAEAVFATDGQSTTPTPAVNAFDIVSVVSDLTTAGAPGTFHYDLFNNYIASTDFFAPQIVKVFDLVLDISNRETGYVSLNGTWGVSPNDVSINVPLFELNLDCVNYAFRPLIMSSSAGAGIMLLDDAVAAAVTNDNDITIAQLEAYFNDGHPVVFSLFDVVSTFTEATLTAPGTAITEIISAPTVIQYDFALLSGFTLAELRVAKTGGSIADHFENSVAKIKRSVKLNYVQSNIDSNVRSAAAMICYFSTGAGTTSRFTTKFAALANSNVIRASSAAFSLTFEWTDASVAAVPDNVILSQTGAENTVTSFDFTGTEFDSAVEADNVVFVCENGYNATANSITLSSTQIFYG